MSSLAQPESSTPTIDRLVQSDQGFNAVLLVSAAEQLIREGSVTTDDPKTIGFRSDVQTLGEDVREHAVAALGRAARADLDEAEALFDSVVAELPHVSADVRFRLAESKFEAQGPTLF